MDSYDELFLSDDDQYFPTASQLEEIEWQHMLIEEFGPMSTNDFDEKPANDNFQGYSSDYTVLNNPRILHQSPSALDNIFRPPFYCPPFVHWIPGQYAVEDFRGGLAGASVGKHRRNRTAFSQQQLAVLERSFSDTQYPDLETRDRLSRSTGLPETKIQVWFKNRRAKHRKLQKASDKTTSSAASSSSSVEKCKEDISSTSSLMSPHDSLATVTKRIRHTNSSLCKKLECTNFNDKDEDSDVSVGGEDDTSHKRDVPTLSQATVDAAEKQTSGEEEKASASKKTSSTDRPINICGDRDISHPEVSNLSLVSNQSSLLQRRGSSAPYLNNFTADSTSPYLPLMYSSTVNPWSLVYYSSPSNFCSSTPTRHHNVLGVPSLSYSNRIPTEEAHSGEYMHQFGDKNA